MATAKQMDFLLVGLHKGDGTINSSGVVTFFESGTSTPKNAFDGPDTVADNSITSITLDATGKAVVFGNGTYRIVIKDSDGNTIGTYDGMSYSVLSTATSLNDVQSITNGDSPFTITTSMHTIQCNATGGAITVTLPTAVGISGQQFYIKKTDSGANAVTVATNGAQTIDGAGSFSLASQFDWLVIESDGSNWSISSELDAIFNTDTINEKTSAAGVTIDSVLVKDNTVTATTVTANTSVVTDTISEKTSDAGVTIDGVLMKDSVAVVDTVAGNPETYTADTIAFVDSDPDTITDSANGFGSYIDGQTITISGSTSNDDTYTIATAAAGTLTLIAGDSLTVEGASATVTVSGATEVTVAGMGIRNGGPSPTSWPSFSIHKNGSAQTNVGTAEEIITWNSASELFDTNDDFIANRFTPTVAGKYLLTASVKFTTATVGDQDVLTISIAEGGSTFKTNSIVAGAGVGLSISISVIVDADGSTNYFEVFAANETLAGTVDGGSKLTYFMGSRIA